jgi:hypothetical protein
MAQQRLPAGAANIAACASPGGPFRQELQAYNLLRPCCCCCLWLLAAFMEEALGCIPAWFGGAEGVLLMLADAGVVGLVVLNKGIAVLNKGEGGRQGEGGL